MRLAKYVVVCLAITGIVWILASLAAGWVIDRWYPRLYQWVIHKFDRNVVEFITIAERGEASDGD